MAENLSIATFQPHYAHPPYLNSPRSLEACRRHGVTPAELVETPYDEFRKGYPNEDNEAILRRYERLDGARLRTLQSVRSEWNKLCDSGWKPAKDLPDPSNSTALERQIARLSKIEEKEWNSMQKYLFKDIKDAAQDIKKKELLQKHEQKAARIQDDRSELMRAIEAGRVERLEIKRRTEAKRDEELHLSQTRAAVELLQREEEEKEEQRMKKVVAKQKEEERIRRTEYTRRRKEAILDKMDSVMEERVRQHEMKEQEDKERIEFLQKRREVELARRRANFGDRIDMARQEVENKNTTRVQALVDKRRDNDERCRLKHEEAVKVSKERYDRRKEHQQLKLARAKENNEMQLAEKIEKTLQDMERKEAATQRELQRMEDARLKRQQIKKIRDDAFASSHAHARQAHECQVKMYEEDLQRKRERVEAIQQQKVAMSKMRSAISDSIDHAKSVLKLELARLNHDDKFTPQTVAEKTRDVSMKVLFPRLQRSMADLAPRSSPSRGNRSTTSALFEGSENEDSHDGGDPGRAFTAPAFSAHDKLRSGGKKSRSGPVMLGSLSAETLNKSLSALTESVDKTVSSPLAPGYSRGGSRSVSSKQRPSRQDGSMFDSEESFDARGEYSEGGARSKGRGVLAQSQLDCEDSEVGDGSLSLDASEMFLNQDSAKQSSRRKTHNNEDAAQFTNSNAKAHTQGKNHKESSQRNQDWEVDRARMRVSTVVRGAGSDGTGGPRARLEGLRREQNSVLLGVLEEERVAEAERERASRLLGSQEVEERRQLELVFAEERKRASERIIALTRLHEDRMRDAVLSLGVD